MKRGFPLVAAGVLLLGMAGGFAVTGSNDRPITASSSVPTVGDFLQRVATTMGLVNRGATPQQALAALRSTGALGWEPIDLGSDLTESDVVRITSGLDLGLKTTAPERRYTAEQADIFFAVFSPVMARGSGTRISSSFLSTSGNGINGEGQPDEFPGKFDPRTKGGGAGKGVSKNFPF
jgi:hypothetical protein